MPVKVLDILSPDAIRVPLKGTTKRQVIDELCQALESYESITDIDEIKKAIWEREDQRSTGIGEGLAIPHGKCDCTNQLALAIGIPSEPLDFGAEDGEPVRLVILLASPTNRIAEKIQVLGKISRMMSDPVIREKAYNATNAETLYQLFASQIDD